MKEEARRMLELLPDDATWDDLKDLISLRQSVERGLVDSANGHGMTTAELRERLNKKYGL